MLHMRWRALRQRLPKRGTALDVDGLPKDPLLPEAADNAERGAIYDAMNKTMAALHKVNVEAVGLSDFGRPGN